MRKPKRWMPRADSIVSVDLIKSSMSALGKRASVERLSPLICLTQLDAIDIISPSSRSHSLGLVAQQKGTVLELGMICNLQTLLKSHAAPKTVVEQYDKPS